MSKLTPCKTCGQQIAKKAKTCPSCGAKNKPPTSVAAWFALMLVVIVTLTAMFAEPIPEADRLALEAEREAKKAERDAKQAAWNKNFSALYDCEQALKIDLRDPSSLKWDGEGRKVVTEDGFLVMRSYRADNVFGGRALGIVTCKFDQNDILIDHAILER